ncbi:hypothetical protein Tco_1284786 [Tanacetum coccineum]
METQAIDDQDHLVNYDNDNENDDLGYRSEEYFDEGDEEDENNHSNGNVVKRGITRLYKFRREYGKPDGIKLSVTFDALNRISGKHRALFSSFLGDMVREHIGLKILSWKKVDSEARDKLWDEITRYFDVDLTVRKMVMNRLGQLLRNFRRKLRQTYILPNQNTLSKLNEVPAKYSAILKAEEWVNFVKYTATEEYKVKSAAAKMARSKSVYQHTMGRGGYALVKEKMIRVTRACAQRSYPPHSTAVQPAMYNDHEIIKTNHAPAIVHNSEDTLEIAKITRKKMNDKMKDPEYVKKKVKIAPHDYSKENYLATFTPQKQLTPEQIFWSNDLIKMKAEALKGQTTTLRPIKALTMKYDKIEQKNLLIANDNLITDCLSKEVFYIATNSELTVSRFTEMHAAHTVVQARCLELEAELSKLLDKVQKDDHTELVKHFFYLEITQLTKTVTVLQEQNELFRADNEKVKQHYKELYNSIKITRAKHIEQTTALLTKNENLKAKIHENLKCITMDSVKPRVLAPGVNSCTDASGSQPRRNTKKNRILPDKSVNKKKAEEHPRTNKSSLKTTNRIDSSIGSKHTAVPGSIPTPPENQAIAYIVLWYLDSGCSKHMIEDRSRLRNFMKKFIRTVRFGNDHFGAIMGYGDYVIGDIMISRVYYVEGLGHNLFSVR